MIHYTPWKWHFICQRPNTGSRWHYGNFTLGLQIDGHPRFRNVILCLLFFEIGIGCTREVEKIAL